MTNKGAYNFLDAQRSITLSQIDLEIERARVRGDEHSMAILNEIKKTLNMDIAIILNSMPYDDN